MAGYRRRCSDNRGDGGAVPPTTTAVHARSAVRSAAPEADCWYQSGLGSLVARFGGSERADLAHALEPYEQDDFAEAARRLKNVVARHPQSVVGHLRLGVCLLFLRRKNPQSPPSSVPSDSPSINQSLRLTPIGISRSHSTRWRGTEQTQRGKAGNRVPHPDGTRAPARALAFGELSPGSPTTRPK